MMMERQGVKCLMEQCSGEHNVDKYIYDNIGSLARHCIVQSKIFRFCNPFCMQCGFCGGEGPELSRHVALCVGTVVRPFSRLDKSFGS